MLRITYKNGEIKEVQEPYKVFKEEYNLIEKVEKNNDYRKYIENSFQSFVHSMSHLSRQGGIESPFTNLSIFDRNKILALIDDGNMGWYFQKEDAVDGIPEEALKDCGNRDWKEYIVLTIKELQDIFMNIMDNGDPLHDHRVIEFPVVTFNVSRRQKEDGTYEFEDSEWVEHFCNNHDIYRYNIYISEGMKVASCCRLINNSELFDLGGQVNSFGGTALSLGSHRVCTVNLRRISLECDSWEDYKERLVKRMDDASKVLRAHKALLKDLVARGTQPFLSNGWLDLDRMFSTFGLMGYYEANEDLKRRFGGEDYLPEIIQLIEKTARKFTERDDNVYNCEEIPGESMSSRLAKADHWIFDGLDPEWN